MSRFRYFPIVIMLATASCNQKSTVLVEDLANFHSDTFVVDLSKSYYRLKPEIKLFEKKLGLPSLDTGFNGLQLRLTAGLKGDGLGYIVLTNQNNSWTGKYWKINYQLNMQQDSFVSFQSLEKEIEPESGWSYLSRRLAELDLLYLPDLSATKSNGVLNVNVEFASKTQHRYYYMVEPDDYPDYPDAAKLTRIVKLLRKEFDIEF
ncbi:MAG: hypothetical protein ABWZ25_15275 [Chitinophagaceae bacterium]